MTSPDLPATVSPEMVVTLLEEGGSLDVEHLESVAAFADDLEPLLDGEALYAPRGPLTPFRGQTRSVVLLAATNEEKILEQFTDYVPAEHLKVGALFLGFDLLDRHKDVLERSVAADAKAKAVAAKRGWTTVEDVQKALSEMESSLVRQGVAALRRTPDLAARYAADTDDGSYEDQLKDVQRRVDMAQEPAFAKQLAKAPRSADLHAEAKALCADANTFRTGREGRAEESVRTTRRRNVLFTHWRKAFTDLQHVLLATFPGDESMQKRIEGDFWKTLSKRSRKTKPTSQALETTASAPAANA